MRLLITGSNGQLGQELQRIIKMRVSELGYIPNRLVSAEVEAVDIDTLDISDRKETELFVNELRPDVIVNCAAYTNVDGCESNAETAMRANAIGPRNLALSAQHVGAKLVHISTDYVFSGEDAVDKNEWHICNPQSVYGYSKYLGEQYVRDFCERYFIVRTAWLYGYIGKNFVKTILRVGRERGFLTVVNDQHGNPTNATDLAYHILKLTETEEYGVYHCTNKGTCTWYDFACEFVRLAGFSCEIKPCTSDEYPSPTKRPKHSSLDNLMLRCTIGDGMRDWEDAIAAYMKYYNKETGEIQI